MHLISSCVFIFVLVLNMGTGKNNNDWNISFTPQEVTAVKGVCALISCTFTYPDEAKPIEKTLWNVYNDQEKKKEINSMKENDKIQMLEPDLNKNNCSSIIKDIKAKDEGEYEFRVEGKDKYKHSYSPRVKITIQEKPQLDIPNSLREGEQATLICSAPSPCPDTPPEITWWIKIKGGKAINLKDNNITQRITPENLYLSTLTFIPTPELHNATFRCEASYGTKSISKSTTLDVMYIKPLRILGNETVMEGDSLNLSCSVDSNPPSSVPMWTFVGAAGEARKNTSAETLIITNVSQEHAGKYVCSVTYMEKTWTASININVIQQFCVAKGFTKETRHVHP